ncbi:MAG: hypothetical protein ACAI38_13945 [Myxococcota bacterium]
MATLEGAHPLVDELARGLDERALRFSDKDVAFAAVQTLQLPNPSFYKVLGDLVRLHSALHVLDEGGAAANQIEKLVNDLAVELAKRSYTSRLSAEADARRAASFIDGRGESGGSPRPTIRSVLRPVNPKGATHGYRR